MSPRLRAHLQTEIGGNVKRGYGASSMVPDARKNFQRAWNNERAFNCTDPFARMQGRMLLARDTIARDVIVNVQRPCRVRIVLLRVALAGVHRSIISNFWDV